MGTSKLIQKLEDFFDLSEKKQHKKREKLEKIILKLQQKKAELEKEVIVESEIDETSTSYLDLMSQHKAISKLLKKAKRQASHLDDEQ